MIPRAALILRATLVGFLAQPLIASADEVPLHALIDRHVQPASGFAPARCSDAEFLRRVSLDLAGMPPTADEARAFLADAAPDKRQRLIDRLLESPHYARHLAATLDVMLMERRPNANVSADEWQAWLLQSARRENKPWNVLAREILSADGDDPATRPAARFALDRGSEPHLLTRDIGRVFLGMDMRCAQCHDHPLIDGYFQSDYHGLLAFVAPGYPLVQNKAGTQLTVHAERAGTDLAFESVFIKDSRRLTGARVPGGVSAEEPFFLPGEEYQVAPADNVKSVPKYSRRARLAESVTDGTNAAFNRNIANRLWAHMFGRGLVHPPDLHHPDNPATDPELMRLLAERFAAMNFDIKAFLREVALSEVYQRSFDAPADPLAFAGQATVAVTQLEQQRPALEAAAKASAAAYSKAWAAWDESQTALLPAAGELDAARNQYAEARKPLDAANQALAGAQSQYNAKQNAATLVKEAAAAAQKAAAALPEDTELADAAGKFAARSTALDAEVAALAKAVEDQTAALKAPTDALNAVKATVDAAVAKTKPLTEAVRQAERVMVEARRKSDADARALGALDRRLETVRLVAELPALQLAVVSVGHAVPAREAEVAAAEKSLADHAAVVAQQEANVKTATDAMTESTDALSGARAEHAKRTEIAQAVAAALTSADLAKQKAGADPVLTEVAAKLKDRNAAARAASAESRNQVDAAVSAENTAAAVLAAANQALADAGAERSRLEQGVAAARKAVTDARADVAAKQATLDTAVAGLAERWAEEFAVAPLRPLTPEQLCWTVFRVTGVYENYRRAEVAELDKATPLTDEQKNDPAQMAARSVELEQRVYEKLKGNVGTFVAFYGAAAGQPQGDFFATADQALFAANGGALNSWVAPSGGNVTERMINQPDPKLAAEELYLAVLTRTPTEAEVNEVAAHLAGRDADRNAAVQELVWGLLNSAEFRFNH